MNTTNLEKRNFQNFHYAITNVIAKNGVDG